MMRHAAWKLQVWNLRRKRRHEEAFNVCYMMSTPYAPVHWWNRGVQERLRADVHFRSATWG